MQILAVMNTYLRAQVFVRGFCQIALLSESVSLWKAGGYILSLSGQVFLFTWSSVYA